jgi:uncharacterized protein YdeI (YjbR/CyaY-like superfamily)
LNTGVAEQADPPVLPFPSRDSWAAWLEEHHGDERGVWMKVAKKSSGIASISQPEALDVALCFGWIDGQRKALDDDWYLQRYTPRRARSRWSARNRARALELVEAGEMREPGHAEIERAQADGRWEAAYDSPGTIEVPHDLREALDAEPKAAALFAELDSQNRYAILYRVHDAKRADTRARRIAEFVAMLARGETPHPRRRKIERPPRAE